MEKPQDWNSNSRHPIIAIADCGAGRLENPTVTKVSLKLAQNRHKPAKFRKLKVALSDGWRRDLVGFCVR
jgi:hypothetical protein